MLKPAPMKVLPEPMTTRREIPLRTGSQMDTRYIFGHNPRKQAFTSEMGVRGIPSMGKKQTTRVRMGMHSTTAPHKTDVQHFDSSKGFAGSFGDTGLTGES